MTLRAIVAALGGDLYQQGCRANVPAPGHSPVDRSVSLLLADGRIIIHGFGEADWRTVRDDLRRRGLIDAEGRPTGRDGGGSATAPPDRLVRLRTAGRLWGGAVVIGTTNAAGRYLRGRSVRCEPPIPNLRHHPNAPLSVYRPDGSRRPALIARVSDAADRLTAVELTYLDHWGRPAQGLRLPRKTVGLVPPGAAVRLAPVFDEMLVGEGVVTTLSAMDRFGLPGWALMAAHNLAAWSAPRHVRRVLIAADRGAVGQRAAVWLCRRLARDGVRVDALWPDLPHGDWNEVEAASQRMEGGGARSPDRRG